MRFRSIVIASLALTVVSGVAMTIGAPVVAPGNAEGAGQTGFVAEDAYLRSSTPSSRSGAAFLVVTNNTGQDDRLIGARSELDGMIELHRHEQDTSGVMRMIELEEGVAIPAGESHAFKRGGDHLMFMGLTAPLEQGDKIPVTLIFEKAGDVKVFVPVDHERTADHGRMGN